MNSLPQVTILMAIYKPNMQWLEEQLQSLNVQTYPNLNLLVWNDAPDDSTDYEPIYNKYITNFSYKIFVGEKNLGSNGAFEELTKLATSEYIAYCDQDDIWLPEKITVLIEEALKSGADLLCSDMEVIGARGEVIEKSICSLRRKDIFKVVGSTFEHLLYRNFITGCTMLVRTRFAKCALPFPKEYFHDWWIGLYVADVGEIEVIRKSLIKYRIHGTNQSGMFRGINSKKDYYQKMLYPLIGRAKALTVKFSNSINIGKIQQFNDFVMLRKKYSERFSVKRFFCLLNMRDLHYRVVLFELMLPVIPEFIFRFIAEEKRKGNI